MNFGFKNAGDFDVLNPTPDTIIGIFPSSDWSQIFKKYHYWNKSQKVNGVLVPHTTEIRYHSFKIDTPLTQAQVDKLNDRSLTICGIGAVKWEDATGKYVTNLCQCYFVGESDWHLMDEHNAEHKITSY
jgi:hypothetical protein